MDRDKLHYLAEFIRIRNVADHSIAKLIGRPAHSGHIGEFVAANIFDIELHALAAVKASDGYFRSGTYVGQSVNVKYGTRNSGVLNLVKSTDPTDHPDVYLVMTGPRSEAGSSRNTVAPWVITNVHLFRSSALLDDLITTGVALGVATSIRKQLWQSTGIYPQSNPTLYPLSAEQRLALDSFGPVLEQE